MLKYRLLFGPLMIAALLALFYLDSRLDQVAIAGTVWQRLFLGRAYLPAGLPLLAAALVLIPLAARELCAIFRAKGIPADPFMVALSAMLGCSIMYIVPSRLDSQAAIGLLASLMIALFLLSMVKHSYPRQRTQGAVAASGAALLAMVYLGVLPGFLLFIRRWHPAWTVAGVILVTKSCDIGAYFTGRAVGRHKLIPWLSPGKTWEGLCGGVVLAGLCALALGALANNAGLAGSWPLPPDGAAARPDFRPVHYPLWALALAGVLIGLLGQFGDLVASLLKRDAGVKDSGAAVPGFGGLLDIIDSPLVVAPAAYWLLLALERLG